MVVVERVVIFKSWTVDDLILCIESTKKSAKKKKKIRTNKSSKVEGYKISIKNQLYFHTLKISNPKQ